MFAKSLIVMMILLYICVHGKPTTDDSRVATNLSNGIDDSSSGDTGIIDLSHLDKSLYGEPDEEAGNRLKKWKPENGDNPEEQGTYLEGDMLITKPEGRNGLIDTSKRWPNGVIPFRIEGSFSEFAKIFIAFIYSVRYFIYLFFF